METTRSRFGSIVTLLSLVALTSTARADIIYSSFTAGNGYDSNGSYSVFGSSVSPGSGARSLAGAFTPDHNFLLTSIDIGAQHIGGTNSYLFSIVADSAGMPTGAPALSPVSGSLAFLSSIRTFSATGSLLAGQKYWLVMEAGAADTAGVWNTNTVGASGVSARQGAGNWEFFSGGTTPAFRVNGRPVQTPALTPEIPAGIQAVPVLLAAGSMALYQRKKRAWSK